MDYLTLRDDHGNTVVVHTAHRKRGKLWTASWSAASQDGRTFEQKSSDYYCSRHYVDYAVTSAEGQPPDFALQVLVSDALWLAWIRSRRDQYEARRKTTSIRRGPVVVSTQEGPRP